MNYKFSSKYFLLLCVPLFLFSCQEETDDQFIEDTRLIESYIETKNLEGVQKTNSGLHYIIVEEGNGKRPNVDSKIKINYIGKLLNDNVFDSGDNVVFDLNGLILGWQEGIPLITEQGRIKLIIPSKLGYGSRVTGNIPRNSVLVFDIDLIEVDPM
jgi:FKBP-type peptidyl-prolyl cis-trans isomerase FkpA